MPAYIPILFILASGVILLIFGLVQAFLDTRSSPLESRLQRIRRRRTDEQGALRGVEPNQLDIVEEEQRARARYGRLMAWLRKQLSPNHWLLEMERELARARAPLGPAALLILGACLMLGTGCVGYFLLGMGYWLFPCGGVGLALPWLYLKQMQRKWLRLFEQQLAEALVLMANALRAGSSLLQSFEIVARESPYPIGEEFQRVSQEIAVGISVEEALHNLTERVPTMDVKILVTALLVQRQIGGALAEVLDNLASIIRQRVSLRAEVRALTAQQRFSAYGLLLLPVFFALAAEVITRLLGGTSTGSSSYLAPLLKVPWLIFVGIGMQILGLFIIRRIVSIEV
ncbi:MAG: type II secretion system F family protein [Abditibacteriales bacterium]|nr:type II secretion system F family protein [Abditibacteriales bacterium]MDW8367906.1 type II secretion system F family protein [Abditibacteriales bacterium]